MVKCYLFCILTAVFLTLTHCFRSEEDIAAVKRYLDELDSSLKSTQNGWKEPNYMFPHDLGADVDEDEEIPKLNGREIQLNNPEKSQKDCSEVCRSEVKASGVKDSNYLIRWLKMFVNKFSDRSTAGENKLISFPMDSFNLDKIHSMIESKSPDVALIDGIISEMMSEATVSEQGSWIARTVVVLLNNRVFLITVISLALGTAILRHPRVFVVMIVALACLGWQWGLLYHKEISNKHAKVESINYPDVCHTNKLGIFDAFHFYVKSFFVSQGTCEDYYQALMVDPFWEVTPMAVVSATVLTFITHPAKSIAETLNACILKLFKDLPLIYAVPTIVFIFLILMMTFNYRLRMPFFLSFEPSYPPISPSTASRGRTRSAVTCTFNALQWLGNVVSSRFVNNQETASLAPPNNAGEISANQQSKVFGNSLPQITDYTAEEEERSRLKRLQSSAAPPTSNLRLYGFAEGSGSKELEWRTHAELKIAGYEQLSIDNEGVNKIKCSQNIRPSSTPQLTLLDSENCIKISSSPEIPNCGTKPDTETPINNMETEGGKKDTEINDTDTEVREFDIEVHDTETKVTDMDIEGRDMDHKLGDTETEVRELGLEANDTETGIQEMDFRVNDTEAEVSGMDIEVYDTETDLEISCRRKDTEMKEFESHLEDGFEIIGNRMGDGDKINTKAAEILQRPLMVPENELHDPVALVQNRLRKLSI